jgi:hypothetical protein
MNRTSEITEINKEMLVHNPVTIHAKKKNLASLFFRLFSFLFCFFCFSKPLPPSCGRLNIPIVDTFAWCVCQFGNI